MIVNPVPWIQSCALWTYRTGWLRIRLGFASGNFQEYYTFYYETLSNGVKLVWSCVPGACYTYDSAKDPITRISYCTPIVCVALYSGLNIPGWSGIQWQLIFINQVVTA